MSQAALCLLAAGTVVSCVDDEYDLSKDIDMTVTVGGSNLVIPASSTEPITLKKLFDLDDNEDQALKVAKAGNLWGLEEGDYFLHEKSEPGEKASTITVDKVTVDFNEKDHQTDQKLEFVNPGVAAMDVKQVVDLWSHFELNEDEVTGQLRRLDWLELNIPMTLTLSFDYTTNVERLYVQEGFEISFPEYVKLESETAGWVVVGENRNIVRAAKEIVCMNPVGTTLNVRIVEANFENMEESPLTLGTKAPDGTYNKDGKFYVDMRIHANGDMALHKEDFPASVNNVDIHVYVNSHMETASIYKVKGVVDPDFDVTIEPVDFVDVPEYLDDPETNIDLSDPRIFLTITNECPIDMSVNAVLKPLDENGKVLQNKNGQDVVVKVGKKHGTNDLLVEASVTETGDIYVPKTTVLELSRQGGVTRPGAKGVKIDNLSELVGRVPARIAVEDVQPEAVLRPFVLKLDKIYDVDTEYEIIAPLAFGRDLNFVYRDTLDGWQDDLDGFELSHVEVELAAHNQVPMQMKLDALPLDADGNVLPDVKVTVTGNIPAGNGQDIRENHLKIELDAVGGTIRNLDGLQLIVTGNSTDESVGKRLNEKQTLQFTGVRLRIKDGITLDLN